MQLVEKHIIAQTDPRFACVDAACFASKNLYNAALYELRQTFFATNTSLSYPALDKRMQEHEAYRALPAKVAQHVLKQVCTAWASFWAARLAYQETPAKFVGCPQFPKYLPKTKGRNLLVYTMQAVSRRKRTLERGASSPPNWAFRSKRGKSPKPSRRCASFPGLVLWWSK